MSCVLRIENASTLLSIKPAATTRRVSMRFPANLSVRASAVVAAAATHAARSSEERVYDVVLKQAALVREQRSVSEERKGVDDLKRGESDGLGSNWDLLNEAFDRCGEVCAEYAKTFYLGTLLMTPERRKAVWAIYG